MTPRCWRRPRGKPRAGTDFEVLVTGEGSINGDFGATAESDLRKGEIFGVGIALVILVLVFGAVVTATVPLIMALAAILLAMGITALLGQVMDLSFFITNMITMIGLAMGTDYSLFVVSRYREERAAGRDKVEAICKAGSTATRAVVFSAAAVILALAGLFLVPSTLFHSMALGAVIAVFAALLAALTLLPALLGAMGDKVNALRVPFLRKARPGRRQSLAAGPAVSGIASLPVSCAVRSPALCWPRACWPSSPVCTSPSTSDPPALRPCPIPWPRARASTSCRKSSPAPPCSRWK